MSDQTPEQLLDEREEFIGGTWYVTRATADELAASLTARCEALTAERDSLIAERDMVRQQCDYIIGVNMLAQTELAQIRQAQQADQDRFDRDRANFTAGYSLALDDAVTKETA